MMLYKWLIILRYNRNNINKIMFKSCKYKKITKKIIDKQKRSKNIQHKYKNKINNY